MKYEFTQHLPSGTSAPIGARSLPTAAASCLEPGGRVGWAGACLVGRKAGQCGASSLAASPWEAWAGNAAAGASAAFRFRFSGGLAW